MKTKIITDLAHATFQATREFNAPSLLVWRALTEANLLDQWWAPKPWKCETQSMEFKLGGKWFYDMVGPNGERHGGVQIYEEIVFKKYFSGIDAFIDENGNINNDMPVAKWKNTLRESTNKTTLIIEAQYPTQESLSSILKMGMAEGVSMAHDGLEIVLKSL